MFLFCRVTFSAFFLFSSSFTLPLAPATVPLTLGLFFCYFVAKGIIYTFSLYTYIYFIYYSEHIFFKLLRNRLCDVNIVLHTYLVRTLFRDIPLSTPHERSRLFFRIFFLHPKLCLFTF